MITAAEKIAEKALADQRLSVEEAVHLFECNDLVALGIVANELRKRKTDPDIVTYIVDRNINYTNICISQCKFCAFYRKKGSKDGYILSYDELDRKIEETIQLGGTQILMQGGLHPDLTIDFYENLLRHIKGKFPIHIHAFSPPEIIHIARVSRLSLPETLLRLNKAGLDSIPGGGAEILCDEIRRELSPRKCTSDEWLDVMEQAHNIGLRTTATMMFGHIESIEDRISHLAKIRNLQDKTNGFTAFIPWTYQSENTQLGGETAGGYEYLKTLAISRIFLDNFKNIQASWVTQGKKIGGIALKFGANDLGSNMIEENVVAAAGTSHKMSVEEMVRIIEEMGYTAKQRDTFYNYLS